MAMNRRDLQASLIDARQQLKETQLRIAELEAQLGQVVDPVAMPSVIANPDSDVLFMSTAKIQTQRSQTDFLPKLIETVHQSNDFDSMVAMTLRLVCQYTGCDYGEVWTPNVGKTAFVCSPLHYIASASVERLQHFRRESEKYSFKRGEGLIGRAWNTNTIEWIVDIDDYPDSDFSRIKLFREAELHGVISVPIAVDGQVVAVLGLMTHKVRRVDTQVKQLINTAAGQIKSILQRQQTDLELKRYVQRMELLHQIDLGLIHGDSIRALIDTTLTYLRQLIPCQRANVSVIDPMTEEGIIFSLDLSKDRKLGEAMRVPALSFALEGLDNRYCRVIDDLRPIYDTIPNGEQLVHEGLISGLQVLLMHQWQPIGSLDLLATSPHFFTAEYLDIAVQVAGQLAVAVRQIRLANDLQQRLMDINQAHEIRRLSEARYRSVVDDQTDLICRYNADFQLTFVNRAYCQFHQKSEQALLGTNLLDLIPSEQRETAKASVLSLNAASPVSTSEHQTILPDQSRRWVQWTDRALMDRTGKVIEYQGVGRDITDRMELQEAQQRHTHAVEAMQKFLQSTLDSFPANAAVLDSDGTILNVNAPWRRFADENGAHSPNHYLGANYLNVCDRAVGLEAQEAQTVGSGIRAVINGEQNEFNHEYGCHSITTQRWFRLSVTPFEEDVPRRVVVSHIDITERKQSELALQEAHDTLEQRVTERTAEYQEEKGRIEAILDNSFDAILLVQRDMSIERTNKAFEKLFLYDAVSARHLSLLDLIHPDDSEQVKLVLANQISSRFEARARRSDGSGLDVEIRLGHIRDDGLVCTISDITERKLAEAALRDSEEKFRMLLHAAPVAIVITDQNGVITLVNQRTKELFGYEPTELNGHYVEYLIPDEFHDQHIRERTGYVHEPHVRRMGMGSALYAKRKDGTNFPVEVELSYIKTNDAFMVMSFVVDITERQQIAAELERQRAFLREVIDVSPSMIFVKDYDARFILVNPQVAKIYGTTVDALIGKSDMDFNAKPEEIAQFLEADRQVIASGEPLFVEEPITISDGTTRWFQTTKVPIISSDGNSKCVLGISTDITERRRVEDTLREAVQKEKELGDLKTRFVSMASHEFRTPLATILALTETVITYRDKLNDEQISLRLNKIQAQVWHLRDIVEDVLQLARIQARRVPFNPVMLNLDSLCRSVVDEFESRPNFAHRLKYRCEDSLQAVKMDRTLMRQVISNLVSNAIKYSPTGKTVTLDLGFQDNALIFQVTDEGIGIPEADLKYLFEPFHRATNVGTIPGTGLGLVITKESIEMHGGTINVTSEVNVGTTFIVTIPVEP